MRLPRLSLGASQIFLACLTFKLKIRYFLPLRFPSPRRLLKTGMLGGKRQSRPGGAKHGLYVYVFDVFFAGNCVVGVCSAAELTQRRSVQAVGRIAGFPKGIGFLTCPKQKTSPHSPL